MYEVKCSQCGLPHDIEALEPSFQRPDEFFRLVALEDVEVLEDKDICAVRSSDGSWYRYFLRVLVPFSVTPLDAPISWGAWVEVTPEHWERVSELWSDPDQASEPPFAGRLANEIPFYKNTPSITGLVSLTDPSNIPTFRMTEPAEHQFVHEQQAGVTARRAVDWLVSVYHPDVVTQWKIDTLLATQTQQ